MVISTIILYNGAFGLSAVFSIGLLIGVISLLLLELIWDDKIGGGFGGDWDAVFVEAGIEKGGGGGGLDEGIDVVFDIEVDDWEFCFGIDLNEGGFVVGKGGGGGGLVGVDNTGGGLVEVDNTGGVAVDEVDNTGGGNFDGTGFSDDILEDFDEVLDNSGVGGGRKAGIVFFGRSCDCEETSSDGCDSLLVIRNPKNPDRLFNWDVSYIEVLLWNLLLVMFVVV